MLCCVTPANSVALAFRRALWSQHRQEQWLLEHPFLRLCTCYGHVEGNQDVHKGKAQGRTEQKNPNNWNPKMYFGGKQKPETKVFSKAQNTDEQLLSQVFLSLQARILLSLAPATQLPRVTQAFLYLGHSPRCPHIMPAAMGCWAKLLLPYTSSPCPPQQSPPGGQVVIGFSLGGLSTKIDVSWKPDKSLTALNARNAPYFLFHYEKWFYLDFSKVQWLLSQLTVF